jgi:hypothetical protein
MQIQRMVYKDVIIPKSLKGKIEFHVKKNGKLVIRPKKKRK